MKVVVVARERGGMHSIQVREGREGREGSRRPGARVKIEARQSDDNQ